jgi:predicted GH43/DUF377 family glycosyl hydrolase
MLENDTASFYYWGVNGEHYSPHNASFGLATMRAGRYAGVRAKATVGPPYDDSAHISVGAVFSSVALNCSGNRLVITVDTCSDLRCSGVERMGVSVVGHSALAGSVSGANVTDHVMAFDLSAVEGSKITLQFELSGGAALYSFGFAKATTADNAQTSLKADDVPASSSLPAPLLAASATPAQILSRARYTASLVSFDSQPVVSFLGGNSGFLFAFNPSWIAASDATAGREGLLVRVQNCSATGTNPDGSAWNFLQNCGVGKDSGHCSGGPGGTRGSPGSASRLAFGQLLANGTFGHIGEDSVVFGPHNASDARGTEDPRMVYDSALKLYWLLYTCYGRGGGVELCLASARDPTRVGAAGGWVRHGPVGVGSGSKSGALLLSATPADPKTPHVLIWGAGEISITTSASVTGPWAPSVPFMNSTVWGNRKVEAGPPPLQLSDGNLIFFHNSWRNASASRGELADVYEPAWVVLNGSSPSQILARAPEPLWRPSKEPWMTGHPSTAALPVACNTPEVAFVEAAHPVAGATDSFRLFFGGADAVVGTAVVHIALKVDDEDHEPLQSSTGSAPTGSDFAGCYRNLAEFQAWLVHGGAHVHRPGPAPLMASRSTPSTGMEICRRRSAALRCVLGKSQRPALPLYSSRWVAPHRIYLNLAPTPLSLCLSVHCAMAASD